MHHKVKGSLLLSCFKMKTPKLIPGPLFSIQIILLIFFVHLSVYHLSTGIRISSSMFTVPRFISFFCLFVCLYLEALVGKVEMCCVVVVCCLRPGTPGLKPVESLRWF